MLEDLLLGQLAMRVGMLYAPRGQQLSKEEIDACISRVLQATAIRKLQAAWTSRTTTGRRQVRRSAGDYEIRMTRRSPRTASPNRVGLDQDADFRSQPRQALAARLETPANPGQEIEGGRHALHGKGRAS